MARGHKRRPNLALIAVIFTLNRAFSVVLVHSVQMFVFDWQLPEDEDVLSTPPSSVKSDSDWTVSEHCRAVLGLTDYFL